MPQRELRQGDFFSPCLFIISVERFSSLITRAGVPCINVEWHISLLQFLTYIFVDDCILFCKSDRQEVNNFKSILSSYKNPSS